MTRVRAGGRMVLSQDQWADLTQRMHGEDNGAWILQARHTCRDAPAGGCVAISTDDEASLVIFMAHLIQVTTTWQDSVSTALEDLRYLADQIEVNVGHSSKTYCLPIVTVAREEPA